MGSKFVKCTCKNEYQDKLYSIHGIGTRVANETRSGQLRCSVCSTVHGSASLTMPVKAGKDKSKATEDPAAQGKGSGKGSSPTKSDGKKRSLKGGKR